MERVGLPERGQAEGRRKGEIPIETIKKVEINGWLHHKIVINEAVIGEIDIYSNWLFSFLGIPFFKSKGKNEKEKKQLLKEAKLLEELGVFAIVLECVKSSAASLITKSIKIPTIGIGSSVNCDGQVLVTDDLLGLNTTKIKFVKKFVDLKKTINLGIKKFKKEVKLKKYPSKKYSY